MARWRRMNACDPFSVLWRHVDVEDTDKTVRLIFDLRTLSVGGPRHPLSNGDILERFLVSQDGRRDASHGRDLGIESVLGPQDVPCLGAEEHLLGSYELLECPSTQEPAAVAYAKLEGLGISLGAWLSRFRCDLASFSLSCSFICIVCSLRGLRAGVDGFRNIGLGGIDIVEEGVAHLRPTVPLVHGVDGLWKLRATVSVDAARIDPDVVEAMTPSELACLLYLLGPELLEDVKPFPLAFPLRFEDVLIILLWIVQRPFFSPNVGQDRIANPQWIVIFFEVPLSGMEQAHRWLGVVWSDDAPSMHK